MVIFLVGLVSMIMMRTLRKDYARYSRDDELDDLVRTSVAGERCLAPPTVNSRLLHNYVHVLV